MPPQQNDEFAQYARPATAAPKTDEFAQYARSTPTEQKVAPGTFQTMKGGPVQNVADIGSKPLTYSTPGAAVSGAMGRAALPGFPQQVQESKQRVASMAPATAATMAMEGGPGAMAGAAGATQYAFGGGVKESAKTAAETYALGKGTELAFGALPKGWGFAKGLVKDTIEKISGAEGEVVEATAARSTKQAENLAKFRQDATEAIQSNNKQALLKARKEALQRGAEELQPRLQQHIQDVHTNVRADLDQRWDAIRSVFKPQPGQAPMFANPNAIAQGVRGSSQGVSAANVELFNKVVADAFGDSKPAAMQWNDIQGVYTKLGNRLAKGGLPGDVWRGLDSLQSSIGTEMEDMANAKGIKPQLQSVKKDWSSYMKDFQNTRVSVAKGGSPLAHSLESPDPGTAVKHFEGDAGDRAVSTLSKYKKYGARPEMAQKYRSVLEDVTTAPKGGKVKEMPSLKQEPKVDTEAIRKNAVSKTKRAVVKGAIGAAGVGAIGMTIYDLLHSGGAQAPIP